MGLNRTFCLPGSFATGNFSSFQNRLKNDRRPVWPALLFMTLWFLLWEWGTSVMPFANTPSPPASSSHTLLGCHIPPRCAVLSKRGAAHAQDMNLSPPPYIENLPRSKALLLLLTITKHPDTQPGTSAVLWGALCKPSTDEACHGWDARGSHHAQMCDAATAACSPARKQKHLTGARVQAQQGPRSQRSSNPGSR